jgi:hypothetical protein
MTITDETKLHPDQESDIGRDLTTLSRHVLSQIGTHNPDAYDV